MNSHDIARMIDHTNLKRDVTNEKMMKTINECIEYDFHTIAVNSCQSKFCAEHLKGTNTLISAAIGFPLGQSTIETKLFETKQAIVNGASEIDYVINVGEVKNGNYEYFESEMKQMVNLCHSYNVPIKAILECNYLNKDELTKLCELSLKYKPDFLKTSTGFESIATIEDVKLIKSIVKDEIEIKAAGGIKTLDQLLEFYNAGATRFGTSSGVSIVLEAKSRE